MSIQTANMTVFAILNASQPEKIAEALQNGFPENHLPLSSREWLVSANGVTAKDISDKLGITDGSNGSAIVITTSGYYGLPQITFGNG